MTSIRLTSRLACALLLALAACNSTEKPQPKDPPAPVVKEIPTPSIDASYTARARFISGLKQLEQNEYSAFEATPEWQAFSKKFDTSWKTVESNRLGLMREWAKTELSAANATNQTVFYPFGGPDFLNAYTFFPKGKNYIFIGLEPTGDVPDLKAFSDKARDAYAVSAYNALSNLFNQSYFITMEMDKALRNKSSVYGVTPAILIFMARTNNTIVSVKQFALDAQGKAQDVDFATAAKDPVLKKARGVKIEFLPVGEKEARTLVYFTVDLGDYTYDNVTSKPIGEALKQNTGFLKYLEGMGNVTTYVKSASYLMHYGTFSEIRDIALKHSTFLLQDDSGISYRFFDKNLWDIKLYGTYTMPIKEFVKQYEKDLAQAYKDTKPASLPFALGYNSRPGGVNLLLATKKTAAAAK